MLPADARLVRDARVPRRLFFARMAEDGAFDDGKDGADRDDSEDEDDDDEEEDDEDELDERLRRDEADESLSLLDESPRWRRR